MHAGRNAKPFAACAVLVSLAVAAGAARAQTSELPAGDAAAFLGDWNLEMDFQGNAVAMTLHLADQDGKVAARLESPRSPQAVAITDIRRDGEALHLQWSFDQGGQDMVLKMVLEATGEDQLGGTLGDAAGLFSAELEGGRVGAPVAARDDDGGGPRRRGAGREALLEIGGEKVRVSFDPVAAEGRDYASLASLREGEVLRLTTARTLKLLTDVSLRFGDVLAPRGNVSPDYPGVYGIWLKRTAGSWAFVLNRNADVWGTMHDPAADVAEIAARHTATADPSPVLVADLLPRDGGGTLRVAWGTHEWLADFATPP
jgi:hypothetical protein